MEDDLARRLASVEPRHLAVDQRDVGVEEFDLLDSSSGIAGLTADLPVATKSEKGGDDAVIGPPGAKEFVKTALWKPTPST
jgi:L-cysteine desulfidase